LKVEAEGDRRRGSRIETGEVESIIGDVQARQLAFTHSDAFPFNPQSAIFIA
jgi:hypothetical protein